MASQLDGVPSRKYQQLDQFRVPPGFRGRSAVYVQLWWLVQATLFAWSPQVLYGWRRLLLRLFGAKIGKKTIIRSSVRIPYPWKLRIGDYCHIGEDVDLYTYGEIEIGDCAVVSQRSYICAGSHDHTSPTFDLVAENWRRGDFDVPIRIVLRSGCYLTHDSGMYELSLIHI